jgi:hypothetical protein
MNVTIIKTLATVLLFTATLLPSAIADVPNTFSDGTPAVAAEVNANFSALDSRISDIENSTPNLGGYGTPFSADGAPKNVVVLEQPQDDGSTAYNIRSRYATSSEEISINGTLTQRPFIAGYTYVEVDDLGDITWISNYIEAPDTEDYIVYNVEETTYDPAPPLFKTVDDDTIWEDWTLCDGGQTTICVIDVSLSATGDHVRTYAWSSIRGLSGPLTVNNMTFDDVRLEQSITGDYVRVRAKGVGEVLRAANDGSWERRLIYYHVNGVTEGDLDGTPFAPGEDLDGFFF